MSSKGSKAHAMRIAIPLAVLVAAGVGFAVGGAGIGDLSAFGWGDVSVICPVGALASMLAAKTFIPRAFISLAIIAAIIILAGRAFCGWVCPVPLVGRLRNLFSPKKSAIGHGLPTELAPADQPLTDEEKRLLSAGCGSERLERGAFDARHIVLGGGLVCAAVFGFPVFCLVCPVGLSFATVFLLIRAFGFGDASLLLLIVPALLVLETVVFRKWCRTLCPISALMSFVGLANRTLRPKADAARCVETREGASCGRCARACAEGIDPRHPELGRGFNECTRCRACADACPAGAISFPILKKAGSDPDSSPSTAKEDKGA